MLKQEVLSLALGIDLHPPPTWIYICPSPQNFGTRCLPPLQQNLEVNTLRHYSGEVCLRRLRNGSRNKSKDQ